MTEFKAFPKIARLNRDIIITEKIDGTNAQIFIDDDGNIHAGSRNRWLTIENDNFGFARWVHDNKEELLLLGPGRHFGEWWGGKIQRGYGLKEKRFSLFNVHKWNEDTLPPCCFVVPTIFKGMFDMVAIQAALNTLKEGGSLAAPGFMDPEGIVIFHTHSSSLFKITCKNDEKHKGEICGLN